MKIIIPEVYMAGPDVFLKNAAEIKELKREIAKRAGIKPLFPLDNVVRDLFSRQDLTAEQKGLVIFKANEILMNKANAIIANITPWHGPSMDVGTAFEIGYMRSQHKPVECYTNSSNSFAERIKIWLKEHNVGFTKDKFSVERDNQDGIMIEDFGKTISDNIMIDGASRLSGGKVSKPAKVLSRSELYKSLEQFKKAVDRLSEGFVKGTYNKNALEEEAALTPYLTKLDAMV